MWTSGGIAPPFLTSALDEGEWWASRPCRFTPGERAPGTHRIGDWVGPTAGLDDVKRKIVPLPRFKPRPSGPYLCRQVRKHRYDFLTTLIVALGIMKFNCSLIEQQTGQGRLVLSTTCLACSSSEDSTEAAERSPMDGGGWQRSRFLTLPLRCVPLQHHLGVRLGPEARLGPGIEASQTSPLQPHPMD
jgi:hypothetical protein